MLSVKISYTKRHYIPIYLLKLPHSDPGDNNLVPFDPWWWETMLKTEKVSKHFDQDCRHLTKKWYLMKIFPNLAVRQYFFQLNN